MTTQKLNIAGADFKRTNNMDIDDQLKCVGRELRMRRRCYPNWVSSGRMTKSEADWETEAMEAVYKTLKECADKNQLKLFQNEKITKKITPDL